MRLSVRARSFWVQNVPMSVEWEHGTFWVEGNVRCVDIGC